jgi:hypothetical protein
MEVLATSNFQPDVIIWGLRIGEPVIALSGMLVSLVCFNAWFQLGKSGSKDDALRLSRIFFLLTGISTFIGGIVGHAFLYALPFAFKIPGWSLGMIAVSALEQASTVRSRAILGDKRVRIITWINITALTLALWFVSTTLWFPIVEIHSAIGFLLVVLPLEILLIVKTRSRGGREILWGILLLVGAVLVHLLKISWSVWFSFFDIGHLFMCAAMWKIMLGTAEHEKFS